MTLVCDWVAGMPVTQPAHDKPNKIILLQPLFEEANRFRRTMCQIVRTLDEAGIHAVVPDLPGMGEHPLGYDTVSVEDIRVALGSLTHEIAKSGRLLGTAAFRAGCLFDAWVDNPNHWRFAPESGERFVRTLLRTEDQAESDANRLFVSGQRASRMFLTDFERLGLCPTERFRTVRLSSDRGAADLHVDGSPLWRHAEPGEDLDLARSLSDDIASWSMTCAAF